MSDQGAALGARLRERDLSAAPATLNLLESTTVADREQAAALLHEISPRGAGRRGLGAHRRHHGTARRGQVHPALGPAARLARPAKERGDARGRPSSRRSGGSLLGDRARIDFDPADREVFIRSTAAGERLGGLAWGTRTAAQALAAAFDVVVIETVGVGQAETDIADIADTVTVIVQPGSGDALQFLKSGIMEIPDVLVVTKSDLGQVAISARRDLSAALRSLGSRSTPVLAVSSLAPPTGIEELVQALQEHRAGLDLDERRLRARQAGALTDFANEHGERGLRALGGRTAARNWLAEQDRKLDEPTLVNLLERRMGR